MSMELYEYLWYSSPFLEDTKPVLLKQGELYEQ